MRIIETLKNVFAFMKPSKKAKHRTLVLVGSQGEVISIKRFRGLTILTTCISVVALIAIIYLGFTSKDLTAENRELKESLSQLQEKFQYLRDENDILMARLVAISPEGGAEPTEMKDSKPEASSDAPSPNAPMGQLDIEGIIQTIDRQSESKQFAEQTIDVENLTVVHETNTKKLQIQFDLRNIDPELKPVSGRTVLIMKTSDQNQSSWLILPSVPTVAGEPASPTAGRRFSISRFKTVKFSIDGQTNPQRFKNATVYVFSKTGDTLLEKDFKVDVKKIMASISQQESY
jgi:hypothetical protein